mgnify:CR=1 FL=1
MTHQCTSHANICISKLSYSKLQCPVCFLYQTGIGRHIILHTPGFSLFCMIYSDYPYIMIISLFSFLGSGGVTQRVGMTREATPPKKKKPKKTARRLRCI